MLICGFVQYPVPALTCCSSYSAQTCRHNGAGKTTTISMLTGLIPVDAGDAYAYGNSVTEDMASIRQFMGVCPQHDVLFPDLTVREHLMYFSGLKGLSGEKMQAEVNTTIRDVGLSEKVNTYSKDLSGGQKRKLSLGCALIGGSKLVYLDEVSNRIKPFVLFAYRRLTPSVCFSPAAH